MEPRLQQPGRDDRHLDGLMLQLHAERVGQRLEGGFGGRDRAQHRQRDPSGSASDVDHPSVGGS